MGEGTEGESEWGADSVFGPHYFEDLRLEEEGGPSAVFTSWPRQLSCALGKANVAAFSDVAARGARRRRAKHRDEEEETEWLFEGSLRQAAACAKASETPRGWVVRPPAKPSRHWIAGEEWCLHTSAEERCLQDPCTGL